MYISSVLVKKVHILHVYFTTQLYFYGFLEYPKKKFDVLPLYDQLYIEGFNKVSIDIFKHKFY